VYWPRSNPACAPTRTSNETRTSQAFGRALAITATATHGASSGTGATEGGSPGRTCGPTATRSLAPFMTSSPWTSPPPSDAAVTATAPAHGRCAGLRPPRRGRPLSHLRPGPPADGARPGPRLADLRGLTYLQLPVPEEASAVPVVDRLVGSSTERSSTPQRSATGGLPRQAADGPGQAGQVHNGLPFVSWPLLRWAGPRPHQTRRAYPRRRSARGRQGSQLLVGVQPGWAPP
jgi:hypothetical protein